MSDSTARWLRLAALSPLLAAATSFETAVALAIALFGTLVFTAAIGSMLRRYVPDNQQPVAVAITAAVIATAIDLLLQALCYPIAQSLHGWLPLIAVLPILFDRIDATDASFAMTLRNAALRATALVTGLFIGSVLRGILPLEAGIVACLIASGLALALIERFAPSMPIDNNKPKSPRARVTGPIR